MKRPVVKLDPANLSRVSRIIYQWGRKLTVVAQVDDRELEIDLGIGKEDVKALLKNGAAFSKAVVQIISSTSGNEFDCYDGKNVTIWFLKGR